MIKYSRKQKEIPSRLVCGSCGVCLDCTLPRVQVTTGLGFFLYSGHLISGESEDSDSLLHKPQVSLQVPSGIVKIDREDDVQHCICI